jgi:DNA-binding response OmpR family regulator
LDLGLSLPGVVDAIRALRQAAASILLLTWPTEPDRQAALDAGAYDTLIKPFGMGRLLDHLQAHGRPRTRRKAETRNTPPEATHPWTPA